MSDAVLFFGILFVGLAGWFYFHRDHKPRFRPRHVLTGSDTELFHHLRAVLPDCVVAPGLAAASLIEPSGAVAARRAGQRKLAGQRVDFAIFDEDLHLLAVVEIARRGRRSRQEAEREKYFTQAGVGVIRLRAGHMPSEIKLRAAVFARSSRGRSRAADVLEYRPMQTPWRNTRNAHI